MLIRTVGKDRNCITLIIKFSFYFHSIWPFRFTPLMDSANAFEELLGILLKQNTENGRNGVLTAMKLIKDHVLLDGQLTQAANSEQKRISDLICGKLLSHSWNR